MDYGVIAGAIASFTARYGGAWPHGLGLDRSTGRTILRPHATARRIHVDGTTAGPDGSLNYSAANVAAAKALQRAGAGDWVLFPAGGTTTGVYGVLTANAGMNASYPTVIGTYDPADPNNVAKYNTGAQHKWDYTGPNRFGTGAIMFQAFAVGSDVAIVNQQTKIDYTDESQIGVYFLGVGARILLEKCIFDNTPTLINGGVAGVASQIGRADAALLTDVTFNQCGLLYGGALFNQGGVNVFIHGARRIKFVRCQFFHGGWGPNATRASVSWGYTTRTVTSLTSVGTVATALLPNTTGMSNGGKVFITGATQAAYNGLATITSLVPNVSLTYSFAGAASPATGTITAGNPEEFGWSFATGDGCNIFNHGVYLDENNDTISFFDSLTSWDCVNDKWTGGLYVARGHVHVSCPMAMITDPNGNDATNATWPAGGQVKVFDHLQVGSADMNTSGAGSRGIGPSLHGLSTGSEYTNGLILNQNNPQPTNRAGIVGNSNGRPIMAYLRVNHSIVANWAANNATTQTNTTKAWRHNITDDPVALPGATNVLRSATSSATQARIAAALARNVHTTFRTATPELASVGAGVSDEATDLAVCEYMARHPETNWSIRLQRHFRAPVGR